MGEAPLNPSVTVGSPLCCQNHDVFAVCSGGGAQSGAGGGLCFNMSLRSECSDIPSLECVIGPEIHVTHTFSAFVRGASL